MLEILYQDEHYVAVDKPAGLLVHRSSLAPTGDAALQVLRDQLGQRVFPVHRLDRATSGVLVFARSAAAAARLAKQFMAQDTEKTYLAVTRGWLAEAGKIDHPVADRDGDGQRRDAQTDYRCLAHCELPFAVDRYPSTRYSLASIWPRTGRRQQIRKHFKHIHHPLIGDTTHGNGRHNRFFREHFDVHRLLLMALSLRFRHPFDDQVVEIHVRPGGDWDKVGALFDVDLGRLP